MTTADTQQKADTEGRIWRWLRIILLIAPALGA